MTTNHPRYFSIAANSRLYVETVRGHREDNSDYVSSFAAGPIHIGVDGGMAWTPTISNIEGLLIVQRTIADKLVAADLNGLTEFFPVIIRPDWKSPIHLKKLDAAPDYVWFRIKRDICVDPNEFVWPPEVRASMGIPYRIVPVPHSHGDSDVFGVKNQQWMNLFCNWRTLEFIRDCKWKGFQFEPMDAPRISRVDRTIDYLSPSWPPLRWYPEGVLGHKNNLE